MRCEKCDVEVERRGWCYHLKSKTHMKKILIKLLNY